MYVQLRCIAKYPQIKVMQLPMCLFALIVGKCPIYTLGCLAMATNRLITSHTLYIVGHCLATKVFIGKLPAT